MSDRSELATPSGYAGVEYTDGKVHAIDLDTLHGETPAYPRGMPLWREPVVCGAASGVSSDEGGPAALHRKTLTCWMCVSILA